LNSEPSFNIESIKEELHRSTTYNNYDTDNVYFILTFCALILWRNYPSYT